MKAETKRSAWRWLGFAALIVAFLLPTVKLIALGEFSWAGLVVGLFVSALVLFLIAQTIRARLRQARSAFPDAYACSVTIYPELIWEMRAAYPDSPKFLAQRAATVVVDERGMRILVGSHLREIVAVPSSEITAIDSETTMQGRWNLATAAFHLETHQGPHVVHLTLSRWSFAFGGVVKGAALQAELASMRTHLGRLAGVGE